MSFVEAIIFGIIQGVTEFLPISSSGHLIVIPKIFGISDGGLSFDAILHLATGFAVLTFFANDWKNLIARSMSGDKHSRRYLIYIIIGSVPAGVVGLLFGNYVEWTFRSPFSVAVALIIVAFLMIGTERFIKQGVRTKENLKDTILIGISQILSFIPGTSRSGITIITGMAAGLTREQAARFSFMLATPIVFMAGIYSFAKTLPFLDMSLAINYTAGFITAFFVGLFSIEFLLNYIKKNSLIPFAIYRIVLGLIVIITTVAL